MKRVLMVAFHYPPQKGSSGLQRTLNFSRYLPRHGWEPIVLTANPRAYPVRSNDQIQQIPGHIVVRRAVAFDAARHFSFRGHYPRILALPDRWITWWAGAVIAGLRLIHKFRPNMIWSTYPIATAHLIGMTLHRLSSIPWVADFRDSMVDDEYPSDKMVRQVFKYIERLTVQHCDVSVFTTPGAQCMYAERYPTIPLSRYAIIANGYDELSFTEAERLLPKQASTGRLMLLHSGLLDLDYRDPRPFFSALAELRNIRNISAQVIKVILRGSGNEKEFERLVRHYRLQDIVFLEPTLPYHQALSEMLTADGLLIFQSSGCNHLIPAKVYEYLRSQRPIFAITDPQGDTAQLLKSVGIDTIAPPDRKADLTQGFMNYIRRIRDNRAPVCTLVNAHKHSREARTSELAVLFDRLIIE